MAYRTIRVYPDGNVWVVKKDGHEKASAVKNTKAEALKAARTIAINQNLTVAVHGKDGKIQRTWNPEEGEPDGNCFLTTACVKYYGLKDDCYQLQTLRKFRDGYLSESAQNKILIQEYYSKAPRLVELLKVDKRKEKLFQEIFRKINLACEAIESRKLSQAKKIYKEAVVHLLNYFKNF